MIGDLEHGQFIVNTKCAFIMHRLDCKLQCVLK